MRLASGDAEVRQRTPPCYTRVDVCCIMCVSPLMNYAVRLAQLAENGGLKSTRHLRKAERRPVDQ